MTVATGRWQQHAIVGGAGTIFVVIALLPLLWPLIELAGQGPGEVVRGVEVFASPRPWVLLARSVGLAGSVLLGALIL